MPAKFEFSAEDRELFGEQSARFVELFGRLSANNQEYVRRHYRDDWTIYLYEKDGAVHHRGHKRV